MRIQKKTVAAAMIAASATRPITTRFRRVVAWLLSVTRSWSTGVVVLTPAVGGVPDGLEDADVVVVGASVVGATVVAGGAVVVGALVVVVVRAAPPRSTPTCSALPRSAPT
ncbi:MAG TPA: hypothetical protein PLS63_06560 [Microthrixaceae bacterium]|nr:hypothetical protein [Microthrixaceae bacterium]